MAYQMMKGKKGNNDGFPSVPGMIARYSALGLTNEQMAANPVWVDKTGNGHDLQMKNFAWKEGSGISDVYPGALVFDGVDDYGVCENFPILTKEKGYTVVALRQWDQDFLNTTLVGGLLSTRNYSTGEGVAFEKIESSNKAYWNLGAGGIIDFAKSPFTWQTSKQYNNVGILKGDKNHGKPLCVGCGLSGGQPCGRFAIWELVFLDHDATEEELNKIKDYFVKTYPWLFPDQAWTVVGKTNEDEDRATIANITGNGNDLTLSNFGFAEGSGYGLYAQNYISYTITNRAVYTKTNSSIHVTKSITAGVNFTESARDVTIPSYRIKVTGIQSGQEMIYRGSKNTFLTNVPSDGIYVLPAVENGSNLGFQFVSYTGDCNITIEQIPEYEGYLVTDGVDDRVESGLFTLNKDWTIVGNWTMLSNIPSGCGIVKVQSTFLYNSLDGIIIYFSGGPIEIQSKSVNAFCSEGRIYLNDWTGRLKPDAQLESSGGNSSLSIASYSAHFTKMAFKNLAIYDGKNFSKDDCIKAYNYLQSLKAK
jgi:hypothetical protein